MTKDEMQRLIESQQRQIEHLRSQIDRMTRIPEEVIKQNPLYLELRRENKSLQEDNNFYRTALKSADSGQARKQLQIDKLREKCSQLIMDNQSLVTEHDSSYWIGMTEDIDKRTQRLIQENEGLTEQYAALQQKYASANRYAEYLENKLHRLLYELRPEELPILNEEPKPTKSRRVGRPTKATREQIDQAKAWRKEGHSIREIARMTEKMWGSENKWSVSYVQKIVGQVNVSD